MTSLHASDTQRYIRNLGRGFNKIQLLLAISTLFIGVLLVRPLVRKKVESRWKNSALTAALKTSTGDDFSGYPPAS
jgi:ER membrane protein complex subunit 1, C-terminal